MAVTFNAVGGGSSGSFATTMSWSHTSTGSSLIGFVALTGSDATGVTWGGVAMTEVWFVGAGLGASTAAGLWMIMNPATGAQTISVSGLSSAGGEFAGQSITYSGCSGIGSLCSGVVTSGALSVTNASKTGQVVLAFGLSTSQSSSVGTWTSLSGTSRWNSAPGGTFNWAMLLMESAGSSSVTSTATGAGSVQSAMFALGLVEAATPDVASICDGVGNRTTGSSTTLGASWTQNIGTSNAQTCVVAGVVMSISSNSTGTTCAATYGGTSMTQLGLVEVGSSTSRAAVALFYLFSPGTGSKTLAVTTGVTTKAAVAGQSIAYCNVDSIGALVSAATTGLTVSSIAGGKAFCVTSNDTALSVPTQSVHYLPTGSSISGVGDYISVQDAPGAPSVVFANTGTAGTPESLGVSLLPVSTASPGQFFAMF